MEEKSLSMKYVAVVWAVLLATMLSSFVWDSYQEREVQTRNYTSAEEYEAQYSDVVDDLNDTLKEKVYDYKERLAYHQLAMDPGSGIWSNAPDSHYWDPENFDLELMNISFTGGFLSVEIYLSGLYLINVAVLDESLNVLNASTYYADDVFVYAQGWAAAPAFLVISITDWRILDDDGDLIPYPPDAEGGETTMTPYINETIELNSTAFAYLKIREWTNIPTMRMNLYYIYGVLTSAWLLVTCYAASRVWDRGDAPSLSVGMSAWKYKWHLLFFIGALGLKAMFDILNDPIRDWLGWDYTWVVYSIEGDSVRHIQAAILSDGMTLVMGSFYVMGFIVVSVFVLIYFFWKDDWEMATKLGVNYVMIYVIAIPFYLFFPVFVTSLEVPGMRALLYDYDPFLHDWSFSADVFDNCFPSLHIAVPFTAAYMMHIECKRRGKTIAELAYIMPFAMAIVGTAMFAVGVLYLGIHWIIDIPTGIIAAVLCAHFSMRISPRASRALRRAHLWSERRMKRTKRLMLGREAAGSDGKRRGR